MKEDEFSFKFPELDLSFQDIAIPCESSKIAKIHEYLDKDIAEQDILIGKLMILEKKLDSILGWTK